ncbi:class II glutamine amidotransferase [Marinobacter subterrani]|uniref:class II glutamine amidotransferase n=1 Tax=Marinobacter subterrani TaxID=1658765 RepID=UPI002352B930|nr:class II glutamine amidotransferase [Marinobacter subterrani]
MCQIFGLNSARPVSPQELLRGFLCRGGGTGDHKDGWGIAYYADGTHHLNVQKTSAFNCRKAQAFLGRDILTRNLIAHVRKATFGPVDMVNSHPFSRKLWGYDWVFAHNGDLHDFRPAVDARFKPNGETDSEAAFGLLLSELVATFGGTRPGLNALAREIRRVAADIATHGTFNFLLTIGDVMFAHGSTDLYWTRQTNEPRRARLVDCDQWLDDTVYAGAPVVMFATQPITDGHEWHRFGKNELAVFVGGSPHDEESDVALVDGYDLLQTTQARSDLLEVLSQSHAI